MQPEAKPDRVYRHRIRVYYEDTDCMGVVYHANYVRFLERARSEAMAQTGSPVTAWADRGLMFPVYSMNLTFKAPARLGDEVEVISSARKVSGFRLAFDQRIEKVGDGKLLVTAQVDLVCTDLSGKLRDLPVLEL